VKQEKHAKAV